MQEVSFLPNYSEEELAVRQWVIGSTLILGLLGCASQAIEEMNSGLGLAMSQHISSLENALGKPCLLYTSDAADE